MNESKKSKNWVFLAAIVLIGILAVAVILIFGKKSSGSASLENTDGLSVEKVKDVETTQNDALLSSENSQGEGETVDGILYPASTLVKEGPSEHETISDWEADSIVPLTDAGIYAALPGEHERDGGTQIIRSIDGIFYTLCNAGDLDADMMNTYIYAYVGDTGAVESVEWNSVISDTGYINGYAATYDTGNFTVSYFDGSTGTKYGVMYHITYDDKVSLALGAFTFEPEQLFASKELIDHVVYSLYGNGSEPKVVGGGEDSSGQEYLLVEDDLGIVHYVCDREIEIEPDRTENGYIVFSWTTMYEPYSAVIYNSEGRQIFKDDGLTDSGMYVYNVYTSSPSGTYTLHLDTIDSLGNPALTYYPKELFNMYILNMDENGNPYHGMELE